MGHFYRTNVDLDIDYDSIAVHLLDRISYLFIGVVWITMTY